MDVRLMTVHCKSMNRDNNPMKTMISAAAIAIAMSFPAHAHELSISDVNDLPISQVATYHSMAGESLSNFVMRISPHFSEYTQLTGQEACGLVAVTNSENNGTKPGAFSVVMGTIHSQIACAAPAVEEGYTTLNRTIHSHPVKRQVRLTALDMKARGAPAGQLRTENVDRCKFSEQDYKTPGYLVACGKVYFQAGRGTETTL
jgi:hypothetical protein